MRDDYYQGKPLRIGNEPQLLIDDEMIEDRWNLQRVLIQPEKYPRNPVLLPDQPWEGDSVQMPHVLWDEGRYRMWYLASAPRSADGDLPHLMLCYAESNDGLNWKKPLLDVFKHPKFGRTNIVYTGGHGKGLQSNNVFFDPHDTDPQKRYKMITLESRPHGEYFATGINIVTSPDGLHWTLQGDHHLVDYHSDCYNHIAYDPKHRRWLLYGRPMFFMTMSGVRNRVKMPDGTMVNRHTRRKVFVSISEDLEQWSYPRIVMYPDELDMSDYDDCHVFRYGDRFLMLYSAMEDTKDYAEEVRLASSPDGLRWERFFTREPFIPRGPEGGWDGGMIYQPSAPVFKDDKMLIYYSAAPNPQAIGSVMRGIGAAINWRDRFVEQRAGNIGGYLVTREFLLEGNRLRLNCGMKSQVYKDHGTRVEIFRHPPPNGHDAFRPVHEGFSLDDCDPVKYSAGTDHLVTWNQSPDLSGLAGRPVYLRFEIQNMGLYSFHITSE